MKPSNNAVEMWAKQVASKPKRPLTQKESLDFCKYLMAEKVFDKDKEILNLLEQKQASYASVLWFRVKSCHTYSIAPSLCIYLGENVIKNFGMSTMIANYLQYVAKTKELKTIGLNEWAQFAFPMGYLTDKGWEELWDAQKIDREEPYYPYDNILDYPEMMESLKF